MHKVSINGVNGIEVEATTFMITNRTQNMVEENTKNLSLMVPITSADVDAYLNYLNTIVNEVIIYDENAIAIYQSNNWKVIQNVLVSYNGTLKTLIAELYLTP